MDHYGITIDGSPIFRVVWSEDQYEKRWTNYTDAGIELLEPEVREYPKYKQYIHEKYVLERLVIIDSTKINGSPVLNVTYEPLFTFEDTNKNYLPPRYKACKFIIDSLYAALGKQSLAKYKDELATESVEEREIRLSQLQQELFGNETDTGDALAYKEGVSLYGPRLENKFGES